MSRPTNEDYVELLDQDDYLIDIQTGDKKLVLEASYDDCLAYVSMLFQNPEVLRVMYDKYVAGNVPSFEGMSSRQMMDEAVNAAERLAGLSAKFPSALAYSTTWLVSKPFTKVLLARVLQEAPAPME